MDTITLLCTWWGHPRSQGTALDHLQPVHISPGSYWRCAQPTCGTEEATRSTRGGCEIPSEPRAALQSHTAGKRGGFYRALGAAVVP